MSHVEPEHNRPPEGTEPDTPFPRILDPKERASQHIRESLNRAWDRRRKEGRTKHHPNQRINHRGRDRA